MKAVLHNVHHETSEIWTFYFKPERPLRHIAGQFIELTLPHAHPDNRGIKRWFTISSAPGHELISITTKHARTQSSSFKQALWKLKPGDTLDMSEAMGDFVLPKNSDIELVFVAGGIGITPFHSIVQWLRDTKQSRNIQLLYSVHNASDIVFADTFSTDFITSTTRIAQPNLTADEIITLVNGVTDKQIFISGPEPMTEAIVAQFNKLGITQGQLITDYFPGYKN